MSKHSKHTTADDLDGNHTPGNLRVYNHTFFDSKKDKDHVDRRIGRKTHMEILGISTGGER